MTRCSSSAKLRHDSMRDARGAAHAMAMDLNRQGQLAATLYAYRCGDCRGFHLTRRAEWNGTPNRLVMEAAPDMLQRWAMTGLER